MKTRRQFLVAAATMAVPALFLSARRLAWAAEESAAKVIKTNEEWKMTLTPKQYEILREEGTEAPFTSPLLKEHRAGIFACAGCGQELFLSTFKFESGTGWPSFYDVIPGRVETKTDHKIGIPRTEYHCSRCGGHQGHVFNDGPQPTGLRYCNNGESLKFISEEKEKG